MKIYIVITYRNEGETFVGIYDNESTAKDVADRELVKYVYWEKFLPINIRDVIANEQFVEFVTWRIEKKYPEDMNGYTKEEWCDTYDMIVSFEDSGYCCTKVFEATLLEDDNSTYCSNKNDDLNCVYEIEKLITMSTIAKEVEIYLCGTGTIVVNWGDDSSNETHSIIPDPTHDNTYKLKHKYSDELTHRIVITSDNDTTLTELYCEDNQLMSLDVSKNTALEKLLCGENHLSELYVSKNKAIVELECRYNQLTSLDVSKNTALTDLGCGSNQLTTLDVSKNTALTELSCCWNKLTSLDVSKNTALIYLNLYGNQVKTLDMSKNTALTRLVCSYNLLKSDALNNLFDTLHDKNISGYNDTKDVEIEGNPGEEDCDITIAEKKGWNVL